MTDTSNIRRPAQSLGMSALLILLLSGASSVLLGNQKTEPLPIVINASVPFYPRTPQMAHIQGVVVLQVMTDGNKVESAEIQSGQPMLAKAAQENVKTWQFERHRPRTFKVTFRYTLLQSKCDPACNCGSEQSPRVLLQLPSEVEISASELMVCEPADPANQQKGRAKSN
jgi:TonB family protein